MINLDEISIGLLEKLQIHIKKQYLEEIIKLAEEFSCCPNCGNPEASGHFCEKCNERYVTEDGAEWFAEYLKSQLKK